MTEYTVEPSQAGRLDRFLAAQLPETSRSRLSRAIRGGCASVNGQVGKPATLLNAGDRVRFEAPPPEPVALEPQPVAFDLLHVDDHLAVIHKPAGLVVHPGAGQTEPTLVHGLLHRLGQLSPVGLPDRPGIVHRIDQGTSGLLVVARTEAAHHHLAAQLAAHTVDRLYHAIAWDHRLADAGTWRSARYGRSAGDRRRFTGEAGQGKPATTHWQVVERRPPCALLAVRLETGRTHQIRVHASEAGSPLVGDATYGRRRRVERPEALRRLGVELGLSRQALHATRLGFTHPITGEDLRFEVPWPVDLAECWAALAPGPP